MILSPAESPLSVSKMFCIAHHGSDAAAAFVMDVDAWTDCVCLKTAWGS